MGEVACDEELFDLVLEMLGDPRGILSTARRDPGARYRSCARRFSISPVVRSANKLPFVQVPLNSDGLVCSLEVFSMEGKGGF